MSREKRSVKAVEHTYEILQRLEELGEGGVTEVAEGTDLSPGAVHRHLSTLAELGLVSKSDKRYSLGYQLLHLGDVARHEERIYRVAKPKLDQLVLNRGLCVHLVVEEGGQGVYLYNRINEISPEHNMIGRREPLHVSSAGKAILAHLPAEKRAEIVQRRGLSEWTSNTITDADSLEAEMERIREAGVAFNDQEAYRGHRAVGAPLLDSSGEPVAAISISNTNSKIPDGEFFERGPEIIAETRKQIEINYQIDD